mgnify:CR=1 FL=1
MLPVELHRIHADMDEHLDAIRRFQTDGMLRLEEYCDFAVERRDNLALRVLHRGAASHRPGAKDHILDRAERDQLALERARQPNVSHLATSILLVQILLFLSAAPPLHV